MHTHASILMHAYMCANLYKLHTGVACMPMPLHTYVGIPSPCTYMHMCGYVCLGTYRHAAMPALHTDQLFLASTGTSGSLPRTSEEEEGEEEEGRHIILPP